MRILSLFACMSICNSFVIHKKVSRPKVRLYNSNPSEIIKNIGSMGIGDEWTYQTFLDNLNKKNVDSVSILSNENGFAVIDKNHLDVVLSDNIHFVKTLPSMIDNLVQKLNDKHINFDIYNLPDSSGFQIPLPILFIGY